jgi:hypothetical protein
MKSENLTFEWSAEFVPGVWLCKVRDKKLKYVILPKSDRDGGYECAIGIFTFGTPKGPVKIELNVADQFMPLSDEMSAAFCRAIDADIAKTYLVSDRGMH